MSAAVGVGVGVGAEAAEGVEAGAAGAEPARLESASYETGTRPEREPTGRAEVEQGIGSRASPDDERVTSPIDDVTTEDGAGSPPLSRR